MAYLAMVLGDPSPPAPSLLTPLQAAQRRLALGLGVGLGGLLGLTRVDVDVLAVMGAQVVGVGQSVKWSPLLSCSELTLGDGGATATKAWKGEPINPAALVAVGRGGGAEGFAAAAVFEAMPEADQWFSFGVGRAMPKEGERFGWTAGGTCGLRQQPGIESGRLAATSGFGRRADRDDTELGPPIKPGSRLALHLSPRGAGGRRTARFFVDKEEVAVFVDIEDDGGDSDWVAGVTLSNGARARLVPADCDEL